MSALTDFFLGSARAAIQLELLSITHPNFSRQYNIVRNNRKGVTVTLETLSVVFFEFMPLKVTNSGARDDLDSGISVSLGDLGELIPKEIERVQAVDGFSIPPLCVYRAYRSDDLSGPLIGPFVFEIRNLSEDQSGATFQAAAPGLNLTKTGEIYRIDRFPMLRGFL